MNLSNYIPADYIPAIITASVALIAAVLAQVLNNWLAYQREKQNYFKEIYGDFISDFFVDVITYGHISSLPRKGHDSKGEVDIDLVLERMFAKIHYGDKHLQSLHLEYNTWRYLEDSRGDMEKILRFKICYYFLLYSKFIFNKIQFNLTQSLIYRLDNNIKAFGFLYICSELRDYDEALDHMTSLRMLHLETLEKYSLKQIDELIRDYSSEKREQLVVEVENDIKKSLYS